MNEFKLTVERLTSEPEKHRFEASGDWWARRIEDRPEETEVVETPFRFDLEAARVGEDILVEGDFAGEIGLECSRCAKRYSHALRDSFRIVLSPAKDRRTRSEAMSSEAKGTESAGPGAVDPEDERGLSENGLCLGEDLDAGLFRGPVIRLDDFFGEVIALAMPLQPLCRGDCPGICPHCGLDLSEGQCECVDEKIESPFAVLAKLKGGED